MKGKYTTKTKFIKFIDSKSRKKTNYDEALVDGRYFSQESIKFKIKIYDDSSIDFDEVETNLTTEQDRKRYLDLLEDKTATPVKDGLLVNGIMFHKIDSDDELLLIVQNEAPYSKVAAILESNIEEIKVTKKQKSKLDKLFDLFNDDEEQEVDTPVIAEVVKPIEVEEPIQLKNNFEELKIQKKQELESSLEKLEKDLAKLSFEKERTDKSIHEKKKEIDLLKSRIRSLGIKPELNGYQFHVSEIKEQKVNLDKENERIIREALTKVKTIDVDAFMKIFEAGEYHITIFKDGKKIKFKEIKDQNVFKTLLNLNLIIEDENLIYRGDKDWHSIVDFLVENGFEQISAGK